MPLCGTHWPTPAATSRLRISASSRLCPECSLEGERNGLKVEVRRAQRWGCSGQGTCTHTLTHVRAHTYTITILIGTHTYTAQTRHEKNPLSCRATASRFLEGPVTVSFPSNPKTLLLFLQCLLSSPILFMFRGLLGMEPESLEARLSLCYSNLLRCLFF